MINGIGRRSLLAAASASMLVPMAAGAAPADTMILALAARSARTLDPSRTTQGADNWCITQLYDTLARPDDGDFAYKPADYRPALAESWESSPDAKRWTFHLRRGVQFHKGYGEVTADDVKFTFDRLRDPNGGAVDRILYAGIDEVVIESPTTVTFNLKTPDPIFCGSAIHTPGGSILSRRAVQERGSHFETDPIGTGPYQFDSIDPSRGVYFKANPQYFLGPPGIQNLQILYILDTTARTLALLSGNVDMIEGVRAPGWIQSMHQRKPGIAFDSTVPGSINTLHINLDRKPFDDLRVRQALRYAIDRDAIAKALAPMGGVMWGINPPQYPGAVAPKDLPPDLQYVYNPEKARSLLAAAGLPNGFSFSSFTSQREDYSSTMLIVQELLRKVGMKMDLKIIDHTAMQNDTRRGLNTLSMRAASYAPVPIKSLLEQLSSQADVKPDGTGGANFSHYGVAIPGVDDLLAKAQQSADFGTIVAICQQIERKVLADMPLMSLGSLSYVIARNPRIDIGFPVVSGYAYWTLRRARITSA